MGKWAPRDRYGPVCRVVCVAVAGLCACLAPQPAPGQAIKEVFSWTLPPDASFYYATSTRRGRLLTTRTVGPKLAAQLFNRDNEIGSATIASAGLPGGEIDAAFFSARGKLNELVYRRPTLTGTVFNLYALAPKGADMPRAAFTVPALAGFEVSYFKSGAGALQATSADPSNITIHARTFNRKFRPRADGTVVAHRYYSGLQALNDDLIVSNLAVFLNNGRQLRVFNGLDPVNSLPRYNLYRVTRQKFKHITNPSLVSQKLSGAKGEPVIIPEYKSGNLYLYNKLKAETIAGPFAVPALGPMATVDRDWIAQKPFRYFVQKVILPSFPNLSVKNQVIIDAVLLKLFGTVAVPGPLTQNQIVLGITSGQEFTLRTYAVIINGAKEVARSEPFRNVAACLLQNRTFVVVQSNHTGSIVATVRAGNLRTTGSQPCRSAMPVISPDRFFVDDATFAGERTVTVYKY